MRVRKLRGMVWWNVFAVAFASFSFGQTTGAASAADNSNVVPPASVLRGLRAANSPLVQPSQKATIGFASADPDQPSDQGSSDQPQGSTPPNAQSQRPSGNPQAPSLEDLGLSPAETKDDPQLQARLDKRTHMLKIHQRLGLITAIPMIATVATSFGAGGRATSDRWAHMALGAATSDLYFTAAYFAIRAPGIPGMQRRGPIRVHRALAWIHGPGMILTPILGAIAFDQKSKGEKVHGIASAHGPVAIVTAGAFGAALLSVSLKF
jgi:hypothetical protein